jgi:hypothetical protein
MGEKVAEILKGGTKSTENNSKGDFGPSVNIWKLEGYSLTGERSGLEGVVGRPVGVRVPPSAPSQFSQGFRLSAEVPFSLKMARVADLWLFGKKRDNGIGSAENLLSNVR